MPAVLITSSEFSVFEANMPSAADIQGALTKYTPKRNRILGAWVGPAPRITRKSVLGGFETDVAWPYAWDDTAYTTQNLPTLKTNVHDQARDGLAELSSAWSDPVLIAFNPTLHGSVDWWSSGQAARTTTRDVSATGIARITDAPENPTGPTTSATHPTTVPQAVRGLSSSSLWLGGLVLGTAALYLAWPSLQRHFRATG